MFYGEINSNILHSSRKVLNMGVGAGGGGGGGSIYWGSEAGGGGFSLAVNCKLIEEPHPSNQCQIITSLILKIDNTFGNTFKSSNEIKDTYIKLVHW